MSLSFPPSPTLNQLYPSPPISGVPVWRWDGSEWVINSGSGAAVLGQYRYVATAGQTVFSGPDANGNTLGYTVNAILLVVNGSDLPASEYTATNGTSITITAGVSAGDEVVIDAFNAVSVANTLAPA